jgi:hypothetical protein
MIRPINSHVVTFILDSIAFKIQGPYSLTMNGELYI